MKKYIAYLLTTYYALGDQYECEAETTPLRVFSTKEEVIEFCKTRYDCIACWGICADGTINDFLGSCFAGNNYYYIMKFSDGTTKTVIEEELIDMVDNYALEHKVSYDDFWSWEGSDSLFYLDVDETLTAKAYDSDGNLIKEHNIEITLKQEFFNF